MFVAKCTIVACRRLKVGAVVAVVGVGAVSEELLSVEDDVVDEISLVVAGLRDAIVVWSLASRDEVLIECVERESELHLESRSNHLEVLLKGKEGFELALGSAVVAVLGAESPRVCPVCAGDRDCPVRIYGRMHERRGLECLGENLVCRILRLAQLLEVSADADAEYRGLREVEIDVCPYIVAVEFGRGVVGESVVPCENAVFVVP